MPKVQESLPSSNLSPASRYLGRLVHALGNYFCISWSPVRYLFACRCPTECRLSYADEDWKCVVSLRFITDIDGQPLRQVRNDSFGLPIFNKSDVEERLRRAQRAILNPSTSSLLFLRGDEEDPDQRQLTFSTNCVSLQISGRDVADLSFCDLPGKCNLQSQPCARFYLCDCTPQVLLPLLGRAETLAILSLSRAW